MNKKENDFTEILEKVAKKSSNAVEFYYTEKQSSNITTANTKINEIKESNASGLSVRIIKKGFLGSSYSNDLTLKGIQKSIKIAEKIALLKKEKSIKEFPTKKQSKKIITFDSEIKKLDLFDFTSQANELAEQYFKKKNVLGLESSYKKNWNKGILINSNGIKHESENVFATISSFFATHDKSNGNGYDFIIATKKKELRPEKVFESAFEQAMKLKNPSKIQQGNYDLIFHPFNASEIIGFILNGFDGDKVMNNKSFLGKSLGEKVFGENLTVKEMPFEEYFISSSSCDDEGTVCQEKKLIDQGKVNEFYFDLRTASKFNKESKGNGFKPGIFSEPSCEISNCIVEKGNFDLKELIKETKQGLLVIGLMGFHTCNIETGDFTLSISDALEIKNGKLGIAKKEASFGGNFKEFLKEVQVSKETRFFGNEIIPYLKVKDVKLI